MEKYHAKSPCCGAKFHRFGKRRRQCSRCGKTWRIRRKKIGRKTDRVSPQVALRYLRHETPSLYARARMKGIADDRLRRHLVKSRDRLLRIVRWPVLPRRKPLIAVADAMLAFVDNAWYTFYLILLRKNIDRQAVIVRPYVCRGLETFTGWNSAFTRLPPITKSAVAALVCDGHNGLVTTAKREGWIIQRCHFHLIARLQSRRSKWRLSRHGREGRILYGLVHRVITHHNASQIIPDVEILKQLGKAVDSKELKSIILGFIAHYQDYRSYLTYPELNLPRTSNAAESLISCVQQLCNRARGFRTIASLKAWVETVLKYKQRVTCNGFYQPN